MAPILPGISDRPEQLEAVVRAAREAGACGVWADVLNLRPGTREHFLDHLGRAWPEERGRYEALFAGRSYLPSRFADELRDRVGMLKRRFEIADRRVVRLAPPEAPAQMEMRI
jgi:DNA repair photolyase